jgi:nicotinamidase/pyrazinamidase
MARMQLREMNMKRTLFWDVDTQEDFISATGLLAVPGAEAIRPALARLTEHAHDRGIRIVATADDHDVGHAEITSAEAADWRSTFPPHCMRGTPGQRKVAETALRNALVIEPVPLPPADIANAVAAHEGDILLHKPSLDVFRWNPSAETVLHTLAPDRIVLYGVATDFCVVAAIEGVRRLRPQAELLVVRDAIAAIDTARGDALCASWAASGVTLVSSPDVTT